MAKQWKLPLFHVGEKEKPMRQLEAPPRSPETEEPGKDQRGLLESSAMSADEPACKGSDVVPVSPKMAAAWCGAYLWSA